PAYHTLGINYLRTGREEEGRDFLEKSFERDPFNVWVANTQKLLSHMDKNHKEYATENFRFHFPSEDFEVLKHFLVPLVEEAYTKLSKHYRVKLDPPIYVDVFSNHNWFSAKITGLGGFPATGACFGNVVALTTPKALPQNWGAVAWHEFAHVVTLAATKNQIPRWLTEGLSVFEEGRDRPLWSRNFTREIADAYGSGRLLPLRELDSGFSKPKYRMQVLISYFQGCLIVDYIDEKWDFDKVLAILDGYAEKKSTTQIFDEVFGITLEEFDKGFFAWLDAWVKKNGYQSQLAPETVPLLEIEAQEKPKDVAVLTKLAWAYFCNAEYEDVPITLEKAFAVDADYADAHAIMGLSLQRQKKGAEAKTHYEKALEKGTKYEYRVREALGVLAAAGGKNDEAIKQFAKAKEVSPLAGAGYPPGRNLYYRLSSLYKEAGDVEKAMQVMEELRVFGVEDSRCRKILADHYSELGTPEGDEKALTALEESLFIQPFDPAVHKKIARLATKVKKHETVVREYELLLGYPDTNPRAAYVALAKSYFALGKKEEAKTYAKKVLKIDEEHEAALEILKKLEADEGDAEKKPATDG
ncbi:MAG: tetratricopeptide repeat protein, partial [Planctomycetota bacterium]